MKFNLLSLLLAITIVALIIKLSLKRQPDKLMLLGDYINTWEIDEYAGMESSWEDERVSPTLTQMQAHAILKRLCAHMNARKEATGISNWIPTAVSFERTGYERQDKSWAYIVCARGYRTRSSNKETRIDGSEITLIYGGGQSVIRDFRCMILLDGTILYDSG